MGQSNLSTEAETQDRIVKSFKKHFEHFGFKKTSVNDIARELNISKKTIYRHFSTKEQIFYIVVSRVAQRLSRQMEKKLEPLDSAQDRVKSLLLMIFGESRKWVRKNDAFEFKYKLDIASLAFKSAYGTLFERLLVQGVADNELSETLNVPMTVVFIEGIISESMKLLSANPEIAVEEEVVKSIQKLIE